MAEQLRHVNPEGQLNTVFTLVAHLLRKGGTGGMTQATAANRQVQSDLILRIGSIAATRGRRAAQDIAIEVDRIREIAHAHGLYSVVAVTQALEAALAHGNHGASIQSLLSILRDAVGCDRQDRAACEIFAAACSVRLSA